MATPRREDKNGEEQTQECSAFSTVLPAELGLLLRDDDCDDLPEDVQIQYLDAFFALVNVDGLDSSFSSSSWNIVCTSVRSGDRHRRQTRSASSFRRSASSFENNHASIDFRFVRLHSDRLHGHHHLGISGSAAGVAHRQFSRSESSKNCSGTTRGKPKQRRTS